LQPAAALRVLGCRWQGRYQFEVQEENHDAAGKDKQPAIDS
jgi:hypothetical protein